MYFTLTLNPLIYSQAKTVLFYQFKRENPYNLLNGGS